MTTVGPGVSEALVTTGVGLVKAIPAAIFYNIFGRRLKEMGDRFDNPFRSNSSTWSSDHLANERSRLMAFNLTGGSGGRRSRGSPAMAEITT